MKRAIEERAGRVGLASRGVMYLLVAFLALQMAFGQNDHPVERKGALHALADHTLGRVMLAALTVGFAAYALWRGMQAAVGHRDEKDDKKRAAKRVAALGKGAIYVTAALTAASTLVGRESGGDSNSQSRDITARVLDWPGGKALLILAGLGAIGVGGYLAYRGLTAKFEDKERTYEMPDVVRHAGKALGLVGHTSRGIVAALFGALLVRSAAHRDPNEAQGVDGTLRTIVEQPYGQLLLVVAAAGLAAYGLHSFVEARYRRT
jgi:hypothetical protein